MSAGHLSESEERLTMGERWKKEEGESLTAAMLFFFFFFLFVVDDDDDDVVVVTPSSYLLACPASILLRTTLAWIRNTNRVTT